MRRETKRWKGGTRRGREKNERDRERERERTCKGGKPCTRAGVSAGNRSILRSDYRGAADTEFCMKLLFRSLSHRPIGFSIFAPCRRERERERETIIYPSKFSSVDSDPRCLPPAFLFELIAACICLHSVCRKDVCGYTHAQIMYRIYMVIIKSRYIYEILYHLVVLLSASGTILDSRHYRNSNYINDIMIIEMKVSKC